MSIDQDSFHQLLYFQATENGATYHPQPALELAYQRPFTVKVSWRSEKVAQNEASSTPCPTFKTKPLYYKVQILPDLREQVLLECLTHWFKEQIACQHAGIGIGAGERDAFWVEDIDKISEGDTKKYPGALKGRYSRFIPVSCSFYNFKGSRFLDAFF